MNVEKLLSTIADSVNGQVDMLELVYDPANGNSVCVHVFKGVDALETLLQTIEYAYTSVVVAYLRSLPDCSSHIYVNLGSTIKVYWGSTLDGKVHGVTLSPEGEAYLFKRYATITNDGALHITKVSDTETINYTPISIVPVFSDAVTDNVTYVGYYSTKNRYYAMIARSRFTEFLFQIEKFLRKLEA